MEGSIIDTYKTQLVASISAAVLLIASLAWNDVIQSLLVRWYPDVKDRKSIKSQIIYALIATFVVILLQVYIFSKI